MRKTSLLSLGLIAGLVALTSGCGNRETSVESGNRDQILHVGNLSEPTDLDPHIINSLQDFNIVLALFEGLTQYDPKDSHATPGVATHWEASDDVKTWVFHLRPDAKWSNGDPVTAFDFVYAYRRMLSPGLASEYAYMLFCLEGSEAFVSGKSTDFSTVGAKALDAHTLELKLSYPVPYLADLVAHASWYPVHQATIETYGAMDQRGSRWTRPGNLVGNGPFTLTEWKPNQVIRVTKSATYWDAAVVRLNEIRFYPIESTASEEAAFRSGQLHVTTGIPIDKIAVYKNDPELSKFLSQETQLATYFYRFNTQKPPLDDVRVRRALSLAIDREQIVNKVTLGGQLPARNLTPPQTAGYTAGDLLTGDVAEAQRLLAEAGFPGGEGFPRLEILFNTNDGHRRIAEAIQQMWRVNLGVDIGLYNQESKVQSDSMRNGDYEIARYAWIGDYLDASTFLELMLSDSGNNQTGWANADYDRLVNEARYVLDPAQRFTLYREAERILMAESPIAPIYFYVNSSLQVPELKGWYGNLIDIHPYKHVHLEAAP
ncbi:peptide ABC transporter substrate-binding protein [Synoicihabitans lomoniglobus]|uniref:Peptide ABC transporter substrate-binding protein n=1 Tax=Synoicihabitans lomoniglobus TaxID=2909285 RepID=A0AAF0CGG9_9BACT|nr:peptide ABC transporter substrate-binding protein [Opitutaceae bacterium LMO-M01]WED63602.1 peptide ABC transporter substrate-binding protein [Opitutaceae bacterium LMO-M01]